MNSAYQCHRQYRGLSKEHNSTSAFCFFFRLGNVYVFFQYQDGTVKNSFTSYWYCQNCTQTFMHVWKGNEEIKLKNI